MNVDKLNSLLNGEVGKVVKEGEEWNGKDEFFCGEDEWVVVEGKKMFVGDVVDGIDEFEFDEKDLVLFLGDGYRGECCYNGVVKKDGKWFWLDIMNEYVVCELEEL